MNKYHPTNKYRKHGKREAYETALRIAKSYSDDMLNNPLSYTAVKTWLPFLLMEAYHITHDDACDVILKTIRVERGRRMKGEFTDET
jgi:hypothetical protein